MLNPQTVICPECHAAIGALCTRAVRDGHQFIPFFHTARIAKAQEAPVAKEDTKL